MPTQRNDIEPIYSEALTKANEAERTAYLDFGNSAGLSRCYPVVLGFYSLGRLLDFGSRLSQSSVFRIRSRIDKTPHIPYYAHEFAGLFRVNGTAWPHGCQARVRFF